jgi:hypothetical protein
VPGEKGADGRTSYLHIKYSDDGETFTANGGETVGAWIGTYVDFIQADSTNFSDYTWNKVRGEDGRTPVKGTDYFDGVDGQDGISSYLWIKYSADADGTDFSDTPNTYMGVAVTTTPTAPTLKTAYRWTKVVGTDGIPGEVGADGQTSYLHIKYSDDGVNFTANNGEDVGAWIGTYVDFNQADSTNFGDYTWNKVRGEDGYTPVKGTDYFDGVDGTSAYLWVRYSQNSDGDPMTTNPTGAKYIGIATTTTASAPTDYTDYSWSLIKGTDGIPGEPGADGQTSYLHIKYSDDGETFTPTWDWETEIENVTYAYVQYLHGTSWAAQGFKPTENLVGATTIKASLRSYGYVGVPPDTYWHVYTDNNGIPGVSISQNGFGTVLGVDWARSLSWSTAEIKLSEPLQEGQQYWLVVMSENGDSSNLVRALYSGSDVYTDGYRCTSSNKGATWSKSLNRDLTFRIRGYNIVSYDGETPGAYIGTYVDFVQEDSTTFSDYTWNKVKGEDGQDVRKFTSQPVPPYDVGDLWIGGSDGKNTLICVTARESGDFVASDWKPMTAPDVLKVDNRCKALFHFDGSINDHRGIMPTFTRNSKAYLSDGTEVDAGVARFEAGQFGQAVLVEEGTENLFSTPQDMTDYSYKHSTITIDPDVEGNADRVISTSNREFIKENITADGGPLTFTVIIKKETMDSIGVRLYDSTAGVTLASNNGVTLTGEYQAISVSVTSTTNGNTIRPYLWVTEGNAIIFGMQIERKPYPTSFHLGTRSPETLTIPTAGVLNPQEGAIAVIANEHDAVDEWAYVFDTNNSSKRFCFAKNESNYRIVVGTEASNTTARIIVTAPSSGPHALVVRWEGDKLALFIDGVKESEVTLDGNISFDDITTLYLGCRYSATRHWNSWLDELAIFDYAPTDEEIQAWYEAGAPFYALDLPKPELPGYVKIESDGLRVYDNTGKLRGVFGSWLKELIRKYGIKIIDGEIYSTYYRTGKEGDNTYIELTPEGNFNAFRDGKRMIFMQASAGEGRITLFTGDGDWDGLGLSASFDADNRPLAGVMGQGERGLHLKGGDHDVQMPYGSHPFKINSNDYLLIDASSGIQVTPYGGEVGVYGDFRVIGGNKNCIVFTEDYNARVLSCFEMPSAKFGDEGIAEVVDGFCRVDIDPIFLQCLEPNTPETPFIVHLTPYDWLTLRVKEIGDSYFIVEEKDGLSGKFAWKLTGYRIGYGDIRLPEYDNPEILESGWEDEIKEAEKLEFVDEVKKLKAEAGKVKSELKDKKTYREKEKVRAEISKIINRIQQQKNNIEKIVSQETSGDTGGN